MPIYEELAAPTLEFPASNPPVSFERCAQITGWQHYDKTCDYSGIRYGGNSNAPTFNGAHGSEEQRKLNLKVVKGSRSKTSYRTDKATGYTTAVVESPPFFANDGCTDADFDGLAAGAVVLMEVLLLTLSPLLLQTLLLTLLPLLLQTSSTCDYYEKCLKAEEQGAGGIIMTLPAGSSGLPGSRVFQVRTLFLLPLLLLMLLLLVLLLLMLLLLMLLLLVLLLLMLLLLVMTPLELQSTWKEGEKLVDIPIVGVTAAVGALMRQVHKDPCCGFLK